MVCNYSKMVYLYRIQNQPWYMQYNTYKQFSTKKNTERRLFHSYPKESARLIINSFFNRSFAGINGQSISLQELVKRNRFSYLGTSYGRGAYFSSSACYSHSFTRPIPTTGERHMFVADVLVGASILGNKDMKTPPAGYDSTTDGDRIFVVYRDNHAYASYLIVYKLMSRLFFLF
jgi:hypothetical protein